MDKRRDAEAIGSCHDEMILQNGCVGEMIVSTRDLLSLVDDGGLCYMLS